MVLPHRIEPSTSPLPMPPVTASEFGILLKLCFRRDVTMPEGEGKRMSA
jgi:hypothetical protein